MIPGSKAPGTEGRIVHVVPAITAVAGIPEETIALRMIHGATAPDNGLHSKTIPVPSAVKNGMRRIALQAKIPAIRATGSHKHKALLPIHRIDASKAATAAGPPVPVP